MILVHVNLLICESEAQSLDRALVTEAHVLERPIAPAQVPPGHPTQ